MLSAEEFKAKNPGPLTVQILLPLESSVPDWNLQGQAIIVDGIAADSTIKQLKERLSTQYLGGMPLGKQQLKTTIHGFLKDASTIASLNIGTPSASFNSSMVASSSIMELSIKSRGGKR